MWLAGLAVYGCLIDLYFYSGCPYVTDVTFTLSAFFGFFFAAFVGGADFFGRFLGFGGLFRGFFAILARHFSSFGISPQVFGGRFVGAFAVFLCFFGVAFGFFGSAGGRFGGFLWRLRFAFGRFSGS